MATLSKQMNLKSRGGQEEVFVYGDKMRRTVYQDDEGRFFVKVGGETIEVFRNQFSFSTRKEND